MRAPAIAAVFAITAALAAAPRADVLALLDSNGATLEPLGGAGGLDGWHVTPPTAIPTRSTSPLMATRWSACSTIPPAPSSRRPSLPPRSTRRHLRRRLLPCNR